MMDTTKIAKPEIDEQLQFEVKESVDNESQVIVHCTAPAMGFSYPVRIWKTIYLVPRGGGRKCKLIHVENVTIYPQWTTVPPNGLTFSMIFQGLPRDCTVFDIEEQIPEPGGLIVRGIHRNVTDIYHVYH